MPTSRASHKLKFRRRRSLVRTSDVLRQQTLERKQKLVAGLCKLLGAQLGHNHGTGGSWPGLPPRLNQTLARLLAGDSEKQVATRMGLSRHTVHVYVKALYRHFEVNSRGELLARFLAPPEPVSPD